MTYDKKVVIAAANKTAQTMRAERRVKLVEWDAQSIVTRFLSGFVGVIRPDSHGWSRQKTAERISFKATFCTEPNIDLTDDEIDAIKDWWLVEETLA